MYNTKISRDEFLNSHFLTIKLVDLQKSLLHRNKFVFELVTDRVTQFIKKNYGELKRFVDQITNKVGMLEFSIQHHMRSSERYKSIESLFKKLNSGYLMSKEDSNQTQISKRTLIRNYLYNLFYSNIEQASEDEQNQSKNHRKTQKTDSSAFTLKNKEKTERKGSEETKSNTKDETLTKEDKIQEKKDRQKYEGSYISRLKNLYRSKGEGYDQKNHILKGITQIWIKEGDKWVQKSFCISQHLLTFTNKSTQKTQIIVLKKLEVMIVDIEYRRIQLRNCLMSNPIELRLRNIAQVQKDGQDLQGYVKVLTVLKEGINNYSKGEEKVCNFVGISLTNKKNKFTQEVEKRPARDLVVKLTHESEVIVFAVAIDASAYIQLPIFNHYGQIECEIIEQREAGLIPNFRQYAISFNLPVQNIYDQLFNARPKRKSPQMKHFILQSKLCNYSIKLDYFQLGNWQSYCTFRPSDRFQGDKLPQQFTRSQLRIQKNRLKRIIYSIETCLNYAKALKNMENPVYSYIFYALLVATVFTYDANYFLHYFISILVMVFLYCHPSFSSYFRELVAILKLQEWLAKLQKKSRGKGCPRFRVQFKKNKEKKDFLEQFKFTKKKDRNIVQKYQRLHEVLLKIQVALTQVVTLSEKIKNIFMWYHHKKTKQLVLGLLIALLVLTFVPLRLIFLALVYKTFRRGLTYRARTRELNRIILFQIFTLIVQQNSLNDIKMWLVDPGKPLDRKSSEYISFQRKVREWLGNNLQVQYDSELFWQSRTMNEAINYLSDCRKRFIIPEQVCRRYHFNLEWSVSTSSLGRIMIQIYGFIVNTPSDRNVLGIRNQQSEKVNDQEIEDNDSDQLGE